MARKKKFAKDFDRVLHFSTPQPGRIRARFFVFGALRKVRNQEARPHVLKKKRKKENKKEEENFFLKITVSFISVSPLFSVNSQATHPFLNVSQI